MPVKILSVELLIVHSLGLFAPCNSATQTSRSSQTLCKKYRSISFVVGRVWVWKDTSQCGDNKMFEVRQTTYLRLPGQGVTWLCRENKSKFLLDLVSKVGGNEQATKKTCWELEWQEYGIDNSTILQNTSLLVNLKKTRQTKQTRT